MRNYKTPEYKLFLKLVRARDGQICQFPNCLKFGTAVHHIRRWCDYPSLRHNPDNGILLCGSCHRKVKDNEDLYISVFTSIILKNKLRQLKRKKDEND